MSPNVYRSASPEDIQALVERARRERARAIAALFARAGRALRRRLRRLVRNPHAVTVLELERKADRLLEDIGVPRDMIRSAVEIGRVSNAQDERPGRRHA